MANKQLNDIDKRIKKVRLSDIDISSHEDDCDCDACLWARARYETEFLDEHDH